jgi:Cytosol aminopeptidase family, N-terminal domain
MKRYSVFPFLTFVVAMACVPGLPQKTLAQAPTDGTATPAKPAEIRIANAPIPVRVLVQSPADTDTDLQIICLFKSDPENTFHGSLVETNDKLKGLLDKIRKPTLFRGELGETMLIVPPAGSLAARKLLIIGLGDSETFTPQRLELVGSITYNESNRLGVAHPFFAPTVLDGGVTKYSTGQASENFFTGFLRAARTEQILETAGTSKGQVIQDLAYLAGPTHATDTQQGIERALTTAGK